MSFWISLVCLEIIILWGTFAYNDFIVPIKCFLDAIGAPLQISLLVCWNFDEKYHFMKKFQPESSAGQRNYQIAMNVETTDDTPVIENDANHLIVLDISCSFSADILKKTEWKRFRHLKWLLIAANQIRVEELFDEVPLQLNSQVYIVLKLDDVVLMKEVYKQTPYSKLIFETVAMYQNGSLIDVQPGRSMVQKRKNLSQSTFRASLVITNNGTFRHLVDYIDRHIDTITKVNYLLTNYLMDYLNATINYTIVSQWGYMDNQTGRWSGMIGDLVENRAEIGATALFFTSDRIEYIDYIAMPTPTLSKFVFRSPKLSYTDDVFVLPFDKFVWYCLVAVFFISALALVGAVVVEWQHLNPRKDINDASLLKPSFRDTLVLVLAATCQQGSAVTPKSFTARIVMIVTYITLMFLYTSYSANIVALLQSPSTKIQTLEDLLSSRLKFGVDDTIFNRYYFSHATEPTRRKIYEQKILQKNGSANFMPLAEGVEKIRRGLFAFHMELGVGYKIMSETYLEHEKCSLQEIQYLQVINPWYAIQKNSSYKELLKAGMMRLQEYGLQDRENKRLYTKRPLCSSGGGKFITASIVDIQSALILLSYGFVISIGLLVMERITNSFLSKLKPVKDHDQPEFPFNK